VRTSPFRLDSNVGPVYPAFVSEDEKVRLCDGRMARWARRLAERVEAIVCDHPDVDPDTVRLTLIALELTPEERLQRSLRRGRGFATFRTRT
jgi:hypothetical protein